MGTKAYVNDTTCLVPPRPPPTPLLIDAKRGTDTEERRIRRRTRVYERPVEVEDDVGHGGCHGYGKRDRQRVGPLSTFFSPRTQLLSNLKP